MSWLDQISSLGNLSDLGNDERMRQPAEEAEAESFILTERW